MPDRARVEAMVSLATQQKFVEAIHEFYAENATTQENAHPPITGIPAILEHEQMFMAMVGEIHAFEAATVVVEGNHAVINWTLDFTDKQGKRHQLDELAFQTWEGDKIVHERFYYDMSAPERA